MAEINRSGNAPAVNGRPPSHEQKMIQRLAQQLANANLRVLDLEIALEGIDARAAAAEARVAELQSAGVGPAPE